MEEEVTVSTWPRVDEIENYQTEAKIEELCKKCINYAMGAHMSSTRKNRILTMNRNYNSYNGIVDTKGVQFLNKTYGKTNITKYIDYRLGKTKIDAQIGEFLRQQLKATVYSINPDAKSRLLDQFNLQVGAKMAGKEIEKIRTVVGADVLGGMPIPQEGDDEIWTRLNTKQKNQMIMQILLNRHIELEDLKSKFSSNYLDIFITSECFGKVYIDRAGYVRFREIDPRDALFEEIDRDNFMLRSPYMGERRWMFVTDAINEWPEMKEEQKKNLYEMASTGDTGGLVEGNRNAYKKQGDKLYINTGTIEFFTFQPRHTIISPNRHNSEEPFVHHISHEEFLKDRKQIERKVQRGDYRFNTKYKKVIWQASKIGHDIYQDLGPKPNIIGSIANPFETLSSYTGLLLNTKDGVRISLQETLESIGDVFNVTMFQLRRELAKAKGKVLPYDKAGLPKGKTMRDVIHRAINDGFIEFSSAADGIAGNISGEKLNNIAGFMKELDLGISSTVPVLIQIKQEMARTASQLTGVNEEREGEIKASATATNATNAAQASRTITLPIFYFFTRYMQNVMLRIVEYSKIAYGILNPELGETLIGAAGVKFLKLTRDLSYDDFAAYISDGRREQEIRELLRQWMPLSINAGEMRVQDAIRVEMSDTLVGTLEKLDKAWDDIKQVAAKEKESALAAQQENVQATIGAKDAETSKKFNHEKFMKLLDYATKAKLLTKEVKDELIKEFALMEKEGAMAAAGAPAVSA